MEFLKNLFKDEDRIIGLSGFKDEDELDILFPKTPKLKPIYTLKYEKNFFLL